MNWKILVLSSSILAAALPAQEFKINGKIAVIDREALDATDHSPVYADVEF